MIGMIWAQDLNGLIGNTQTNLLPWPKISEDLQYLKQVTMGNIVVMGRNTYQSLPNGPLNGRINVVLSSRLNDSKIEIIKSFNEIQRIINKYPSKNVFIIGGRSVYKAFLPMAQRLYRTTIEGVFEGNLFMPEISYNNYKKISTKEVLSVSGFKLNFEVFEKIKDSNKLIKTS